MRFPGKLRPFPATDGARLWRLVCRPGIRHTFVCFIRSRHGTGSPRLRYHLSIASHGDNSLNALASSSDQG
jgi:hypothetical protein